MDLSWSNVRGRLRARAIPCHRAGPLTKPFTDALAWELVIALPRSQPDGSILEVSVHPPPGAVAAWPNADDVWRQAIANLNELARPVTAVVVHRGHRLHLASGDNWITGALLDLDRATETWWPREPLWPFARRPLKPLPLPRPLRRAVRHQSKPVGPVAGWMCALSPTSILLIEPTRCVGPDAAENELTASKTIAAALAAELAALDPDPLPPNLIAAHAKSWHIA